MLFNSNATLLLKYQQLATKKLSYFKYKKEHH